MTANRQSSKARNRPKASGKSRPKASGKSRPKASGKAARRAFTTEESLRAGILKRAKTAREIKGLRPRPDEESLRAAYLDLLKLCLCDLAGARTLSVGRSGNTRRVDSPVLCWEASEEELALRALGGDWPFGGLTMVGLVRLDDLQACIESVVADRVEGDVIEAGAWRGGASILARATLDSLGADERTVLVADSFQGLPPPDPEAFPEDRNLDLSGVDFLAVPVAEVRDHFARFGCEHGVEFVEGLFDQTLPALRGRRWAVVRLDGDTYESIWVGLESLYPGLAAGGYLIIDDYRLLPECRRAVDDYRREHGIKEPIEQIDWNGVRWRKEAEPASIERGEASTKRAKGGRRRGRARVAARSGKGARAHIPTRLEFELERQLNDVRERLDATEAELGRLRSAARKDGQGKDRPAPRKGQAARKGRAAGKKGGAARTDRPAPRKGQAARKDRAAAKKGGAARKDRQKEATPVRHGEEEP